MNPKTTRNTTCAAVAVLLAIASSPARAAAGTLTVLPQTTTVVYALHNDTDGPEGTKQVDERATIGNQRGSDYSLTIAMGSETPSNTQLILTAGDLRAASPPANSSPDEDPRRVMSLIGALDILAHTTQNALEPIAMGSQWQSTVHLVLPGGDVATIPLAIIAQSVHGTDVRLVANGTGSGTLHAKGHTLKVHVAVDVAAEFRNGRVGTATVTRSIVGHAFIKTISFKDTWTVAP